MSLLARGRADLGEPAAAAITGQVPVPSPAMHGRQPRCMLGMIRRQGSIGEAMPLPQPSHYGEERLSVSLRYAVLALLSAEPMTGYDLVRYFDDTVGLTWAASHSQLYPELRRMEAEGLVSGNTIPRGRWARKRVYSITPRGEHEFRTWTTTPLPYPPERDAHRLQILYGEFADLNTVRKLLNEHIDHYTWRRGQWNKLRGAIGDNEFRLLQARLESSSPQLRRRIIAFKELGLEGNIARADAEIAWARRGLELIAALEREESGEGLPAGKT